MNGIHEVTGSIPVWSTNFINKALVSGRETYDHPHCASSKN